MEDSDWIAGDGDFHVDIPGSERNRRLPAAQQRNAGRIILSSIPALSGRSPQEVANEAARIQMNEYFGSFEEFDRCLDSWGVLNGRASHRYSTKAFECVRVCRFGSTVRKKKTTTSPPDTNPSSSSNALHVSNPHSDDDHHNGLAEEIEDDNWLGSTDWTASIPHGLHPTGKENSSLQTKLPLTERRNPLAPRNMSQAGGIILSDITNSQVVPTASQRGTKSLIKHTSEWFPPANPTKNGRKIPAQGACGQLTRLLPHGGSGVPLDPTADGVLPCPFRVRATRHTKSGRITITVCNLTHTCPQYKHKWRASSHKSKWLAETLANRVIQNMKVPVKDMEGGFRMDYKQTSNYFQMWRAKDHVRDWFLGGQRYSYHKIPALLDRLMEVDPGCIVEWNAQERSNIFKRAFICPSATRTALQYCQPLVSLDACHTKNRKFPTQLFLASVLDGNGHVVILCYAVAPSENKDNWTWFLQLLKKSIYGIDQSSIPLISDRAKGLLPAVEQVFPCNIHAHCANHLRGNVKTNFGKAASQIFTGCIYASTKDRFDLLLEKLQNDASSGEAAVKYIREIDPRLYARHAFPLPRLGKVCSNPAEQANSGLLPIRQYAPFKILVELWFYIQQKHRDRKIEIAQCSDMLASVALRRHQRNKESFGQWQIYEDGANLAKVATTDKKQEYLLAMTPTPTCSCWELQEMMWPCEHIMAWDNHLGRDYNRHFHMCWRTSSVRALYHHTIPPFLSEELPLSSFSQPPEAAVTKGRHRVVRIASGGGSARNVHVTEDEYIDSQGNLFLRYDIEDNPANIDPMPRATTNIEGEQRKNVRRKRRPSKTGNAKTCGKCGASGHNRRTCPTGTQGNHQTTSEAIVDPEPDTMDGGVTTVEEVADITIPLSTQDAHVHIDEETWWDIPPNGDGVNAMEEIQPDAPCNTPTTELSPCPLQPEQEAVPNYPPSDGELELSSGPQIIGGRFGHTQNSQHPEWEAVGLDNWAEVEDVQYWIELANKAAAEAAHERVSATMNNVPRWQA